MSSSADPQFTFRQALNDRVFSFVAVVLTWSFVLLYLCGGYHQLKKPNSKKKWNYILHASSIVSLILFSLHSTLICLNNWSVFADSKCAVIQKVIFAVYHAAKGCMYFVLVTRLRVIFQDSIFAYSNVLLNTLSAFVVVLMYGLIIADILFVYGDLQTDPWKRCIRTQTDEINVILCKFFLILDACVSLLCLSLFIYKMRQCLITQNKLNKNDRSQAQSAFHFKLSYIMIKYSVLTFISILSTSIFIVFFTFIDISSSYSLCFDAMVNAFCILVMAKFYDAIYKGCPMCYYLHVITAKLCFNQTYPPKISRIQSASGKNDKKAPLQHVQQNRVIIPVPKKKKNTSNQTNLFMKK
eukprot:119628_1